MNLVFFGPPGVGKGTQAKKFAGARGIPHISTGDILRESVKAGTEVGLKAGSFMEAGKLVPDEVMIGVVEERMAKGDCSKGYVLDGFPRTVPQAEALDALLEKIGLPLKGVVSFEAADQTVVERISGRRTCPKCGAPYHVRFNRPKQEGVCDADGEKLIQRPDDVEEKVRERLKNYRNLTTPLVPYYREKGIYLPVPAEGAPQEVFAGLEKALAAL